jgi:RNA polymerase primary sigma factor
LTDREKEVLSQRFGFNSKGKAATLKDIGSELQISKERVRQLQNSGLEKLREVLQAHRARL